MSSWSTQRFRTLPGIVLALGWGLLCFFAPWQQVHPGDHSLIHSLRRVPIWSHAYDGMPGARLDAFELALEGCVVFFLGILLLIPFQSNTSPEASR